MKRQRPHSKRLMRLTKFSVIRKPEHNTTNLVMTVPQGRGLEDLTLVALAMVVLEIYLTCFLVEAALAGHPDEGIEARLEAQMSGMIWIYPSKRRLSVPKRKSKLCEWRTVRSVRAQEPGNLMT